MLVLARHAGESIMVGDSIEILVERLDRGAAHLIMTTAQGAHRLNLTTDEMKPIATDIQIFGVGIFREVAKIGVLAPKSVVIHRKEVWERERRNRNLAVVTP